MRLTTFFKNLLRLASPVSKVEVGGDERAILIDVSLPKRGLKCGECGRRARRKHGLEGKLRSWRHLSCLGYPVELRSVVYRVMCDRCGVRTMGVPWARTGSVFTRGFEDEVAWFLQRTDQTTCSSYFGIAWETAGKIARRVVHEKLDGSLLKNLRNIGIDEISYGRPRKFLTVVVDHDRGRVVWAGEGKSSETLGKFFGLLTAEQRASIQVVTIDMSAAFIKSIRENVPHAEIVFDRFHVIQLLTAAIDEVRRVEMRAARPGEERNSIKGSRYPLLKNHYNLKSSDLESLASLQKNNRRLYRAYLMKEAFQDIYTAKSAEQADRRYSRWRDWVTRSNIEPLKQLCRTLSSHWDGIRGFFIHRITNARAEGMNSKIRMLSHRAYGFHSAPAAIAMMQLCCSGITIEPLGHRMAAF
jgi:transposase